MERIAEKEEGEREVAPEVAAARAEAAGGAAGRGRSRRRRRRRRRGRRGRRRRRTRAATTESDGDGRFPVAAMATNPGNKRARSASLFERAQALFPGGVNSPVRAFKAVGGTPVFIDRGVGRVGLRRRRQPLPRLRRLVGPADPRPRRSRTSSPRSSTPPPQGTTFGAPTAREVEFGELVRFMMPSMEKMRLVSSGTEATMSALRVARGFTGRGRIVKIDGGYHGHADMLLAKAGSGVVTLGLPGSARRARGGRRRHGGRPVQRPRRHARRVRGEPRRHRRAHRRADPRQHGRRAAAARPTCRCCAACATSTARC